MIKLTTLTDYLDIKYPPSLAESWDKVGLHFGHKERTVGRIMTALDLRPEVLGEAIEQQVDTIILHHPPIFKPIDRFDLVLPSIQLYSDLIKHDINVFVLHTNLDKAANGMNDWLAEALNLQEVNILQPEASDSSSGLGRYGRLPQALNLADLALYLKEHLMCKDLTIIKGKVQRDYQTVAIVGGSAWESVQQAVAVDADVFITGDISYHHGHDCLDQPILTIDAGHYIESVFNQKMAKILHEASQTNDWQVEILASKANTNPFEVI
ncbi:Nif3-like dinuclear metal center hexameric protein [Vaginisenegalia massiliensis]|uniref:Nif3-like dinuclear metal center hexameric protein n=1 Tax=Vaginisenegalia massiliensis TaxID=2058294 RepID=UPI000F5405AA|nr:Nif3-like dinuclear metal center hexameric protein [Vaginisenegalia massiliensis]